MRIFTIFLGGIGRQQGAHQGGDGGGLAFDDQDVLHRRESFFAEMCRFIGEFSLLDDGQESDRQDDEGREQEPTEQFDAESDVFHSLILLKK